MDGTSVIERQLTVSTDAPDPGLAAVYALAQGVALGLGAEDVAAHWAILGDEVVPLGCWPTPHVVPPMVLADRGVVVHLVAGAAHTRDLERLSLQSEGAIPLDEVIWGGRRVGDHLLLRGRRLWLWDHTRGALVEELPDDAAQDWTLDAEGAPCAVMVTHNSDEAVFSVWDLRRRAVRVTRRLARMRGPILSVGAVRLLHGGAELVAVVTSRHGEHAVSELMVHADREWRCVGAWSAGRGPDVFGIVELALPTDDLAIVQGPGGCASVSLRGGPSWAVPRGAEGAGAGVVLCPPATVLFTATGERAQLTPTQPGVSLSPDGAAAYALGEGRVLGWRLTS